MSWFEASKKNDELKRLQKEARRFRLGDEIEREVRDIVTEVVAGMVFGGVKKALNDPDEKLMSMHSEILSLPTEELARINKIPEGVFADEINVEVYAELTFVTKGFPSPSAKYIDDLKAIVLSIEFNEDDVISGPGIFAAQVADRLSLMAYHEVIHFIKKTGGFDEKTKRYVRPEEDPIQYVFQDTETENHLSDFHNFVLGSPQTLITNVPYAIDTIMVSHEFDEGLKKRKYQSRLYSTIQEMGSIYNGTRFEGLAAELQHAFMSALRRDNQGIQSHLDSAKVILDGLR